MAKQITCPNDEFMVRSEDEDELVEVVREHSRRAHDEEMSESDARDMVTEA